MVGVLRNVRLLRSLKRVQIAGSAAHLVDRLILG